MAFYEFIVTELEVASIIMFLNPDTVESVPVIGTLLGNETLLVPEEDRKVTKIVLSVMFISEIPSGMKLTIVTFDGSPA